MKGFNLIDRIKDIFSNSVHDKDKRMNTAPLDFFSCFILQFTGDSKVFSLESIRRSLISHTGHAISRSAFWERLTSRRFGRTLSSALTKIMQLLSDRSDVNSKLTEALGVSGLSFFDSTIVTLLPRAKSFFDGTFTDAGIKFHLEMDGISGTIKWAMLSAASVHDNCAFPSLSTLSGKLSIFDLGYFDWARFKAMDLIDAFFLSRVKTNSSVRIHEIISGLGKKHLGKKLSDIRMNKCCGNIIEFITHRKIEGDVIKFRVIGFWNPGLKKYHWYITNLKCNSLFIAPLYRLRWQIDLLIKAAKQSINLNQLPSGNEKIILNLCVARMIAISISMVIRKIGLLNTHEDNKRNISLQRSAKILSILSNDLLNYIIGEFYEIRNVLRKKIDYLLLELYDPNADKRKTTMGYMIDLVTGDMS